MGTTDALSAVFGRLAEAGPAFAAFRDARRVAALDAALGAMAAGAPVGVPSLGVSSTENARAVAEILRIYGVADLNTAQRRHDADRQVLRALVEATAVRLGSESIERMGAVLDHVDEVLARSDGPSAPASGLAVDRLARALGAWLVHTSDLPYPALREDLALLHSGPTGAPPSPEPAKPPGGTPYPPPDPEVHWDYSNLGVPPWRGWDERGNPAVRYPAWLLGQDDGAQLRKLLVDPAAGGFAFVPLIRRFRTTVALYEALRLPVAERRTAVRALVTEVRAYLAEGRARATTALRGGDEPEWSTLTPLLRAAVAAWFDPAADAALTTLALEEIDAIAGWTTADVVAVSAMVIGVAAVLASMGTGTPAVVAAVTAVAAAAEGAVVGIQLGTLVARRADAAVLGRFDEIDTAVRLASTEEIDHEIALTVAMTLLPPFASRGAVVLARGVSRRIPGRLVDVAEAATERWVQPWMREAPTPGPIRPATSPPGRVRTEPPASVTLTSPAPRPSSRATPPPAPPSSPHTPAQPPEPGRSAPTPSPPPPSTAPAPPPSPVPIPTPAPNRNNPPSRQEPGHVSPITPEHQAAIDAANAEQSARLRALDEVLDAEVEDAFAEAVAPVVRGGKRPTVDGVRVPRTRRSRLDLADIARTDGEPVLAAVARVKQLMLRRLSHTPLRGAWDQARAAELAGRTVEDLGRAAALEAYNRVRNRFWTIVRADASTRAFVESAGFVFDSGLAPLLRVSREGIPLHLRRVTLDHSARKAVGTNWRKVLDPDNLVFEFQDANSLRESIGVSLDLH